MGHDVLLGLHFLGLFLGGASGIGLPVIGAVGVSAGADHRATLARAVTPLKRAGHAGLGLLILTGVWMATSAGLWSGAPVWFWIKLAAVLGLIVGIVLSGKAGPRAMAGDAGAQKQAKTLGILNLAFLVVIVFAAVFAFH